MFKTIKRIHLIGIGGSGMSGIGAVLNSAGYVVSGSDAKKSEVTRQLEKSGIKVFIGHKSSNVENAQVVVYSSAVSKENVEVVEALKRKIPVIPRAEMLAELARLKYAITIAGTHGKTTTTSLLSVVLDEAGYDPTIIVGGKLKSLGSGAKFGGGDFLVAEADESDGSFLKLSPTITLVTNIDNDHLDYYKDFEKLKEAFVTHINSVPFYGFSVLCTDDPVVSSIIRNVERKYITYGLESKADYTARDIVLRQNSVEFNVLKNGEKLGMTTLNLFGKHNISNALGVSACAVELGIDLDIVSRAFQKFSGVGRRLEFYGVRDNVLFYDDYAHHPTEIRSTITAVKERFPGKRILCVFQPHRYTRTKLLFNEIARSLRGIDRLYLTEIYPAGEKPINGVSSNLIIDSLKKEGIIAELINVKTELCKIIVEIKKNDIFLTMGAGDICTLHKKIKSQKTMETQCNK